MAATKADLGEWFDRGVADSASHMIVVVDEYDWDDYPVYVEEPGKVAERVAGINGQSMQRVMEVYDLRASKAEQMAERRVWRVPA